MANEKAALHELKKRHFDLIIIMAGLDKETTLIISRNIKALYPDICQLMLVNNNADLSYLSRTEKEISQTIERVFVWNGSTKVFLAMAKYLEDKMNLEADTKLGDVRVILVVEDSVKYYSRYLPLLYTEIMSQTQAIIAEEPSEDEMGIILRMRVRPKLILVSNFEDAVTIIDKYRNNIIGVISDVRYARNGVEDEDAGVNLIKYVQELDNKIPCLLQSHEADNEHRAREINAHFINKNSLPLAREIQDFIKNNSDSEILYFGTKTGRP